MRKTISITADIATELNILAENPSIKNNSNAIKETIFFQEIQNSEDIRIILGNYLTFNAIILAIRLLAQSNSLHTLDLSANNLGEHGPAVAEALAQSNSVVYTNLGVKKELQTKINILTQANKDNLLVYLQLY